VICVIVGSKHPYTRHVVLLQDLEDPRRVIGRIDNDGFLGFSIADEIHEVDHLLSERI